MKKQPTTIGPSRDQEGKGLGFNGQDNSYKPSKEGSRFAGNQHTGVQNPNKTENFGRLAGATVGNTARDSGTGPKRPPTSKVPAFEAAGKRLHDGTFNAGPQDRTPGGTRSWEPEAGQNYKGNIDRINEGRGPTKGNKQ